MAGVEEREVKLEGVLLQAFKKLILRVARGGLKRHGLCPLMPRARGWLRGAALSMVVTRLGSFLRGSPGRLRVENPCQEEPSWAPSKQFSLEALTPRGDPPRPTFRLRRLGMVTPEAGAKWRGPARPNAASASKKVSAVEPSEADAIVLLCKEEEGIFCECFEAPLCFKKKRAEKVLVFRVTVTNQYRLFTVSVFLSKVRYLQ